ncbi:TPA: hypothetical protein ACXRYH_004850 [Klebsiella pneumoniae]|jgi:hypothetical protein|uniref:Uncharacterized protein n=1 Tax=Enterobacter ludwigii TaxID=299767 RepID=A0AAX3LF83_9ENTR|nr:MULTISPECIES: hypothetical protein [Enterobacteriaceae]WCE14664.1 hypothetical protein PHA72_07300 [Enterobacter ludwigii]
MQKLTRSIITLLVCASSQAQPTIRATGMRTVPAQQLVRQTDTVQ